MNFIINILKNIYKNNNNKSPKQLGRWFINNDKKILDKKIYLANYDHCGPCGKIKLDKNKNVSNKYNETYL